MKRQKIFNHDIMNCTHESVVGNHLYSGRVLGSTETEDIIQLHPDLRSQWDVITAHYDRIGLSHSHNAIWDVSLHFLTDYPNYNKSVFLFGNATGNSNYKVDWFREIDEKWFNVVQFINSKNNFVQLARELGVSIPKTFCFDNKSAVTNPDDFPYPCYLKPAISVDGAGIFCCKTPQELTQALKIFPDGVPLQIQEGVTASSFLNLQYQVTANGLERLAASEQILDGYAHIGNRYPSSHQPWELVEPIAQWMAQRGMKEVFAFDVAVVNDDGEPRYFAIECNPRFNGASYPTGVANKLKVASWSCETLTTQHRSLSQLDLRDIEFDPQTEAGVVLVNWGCILVGRIGVLFAGSIEQQHELKAALKQRL